MLITAYSKDLAVLFAVVAPDAPADENTERKGDVAVIRDAKSQKLIGVNFFGPEKILPAAVLTVGHVTLSAESVAKLNAALTEAGFTEQLVADTSPKFVIGHIDTLKDHPDSNHLHVASVDVGQDKPLQIVVGAPNAAAGEKVVVALPGAFMPSGKIIWPGKLRGVPSFGMMCSPRELALPNAPEKRGILLLPADAPVGAAFKPAELDLKY
ncbi:MAG: DUF4479 and tRNA-binding domain-containing protein [Schleiferilactobacillus harbinensis]|nr:DUF4479 and tRNA-binding domain-containing protein [Schleiferilactobacillus harbinensis]MCI1912301.1 DUF4479 and tRNA-binding domain-containing protein [Schleiferilactobacillus harbinensis]